MNFKVWCLNPVLEAETVPIYGKRLVMYFQQVMNLFMTNRQMFDAEMDHFGTAKDSFKF
jgi:hypothetical protein